jgi:competence protein ComEA
MKLVSGWALTAILLLAVIIAGSVFIGLKCHSGPELEISLMPERAITGTIYVGGAVNNPGYYPVFAGDTLEDIIAAAGGLIEGASLDNVVFTISEATEAATPQKIDINRAEVWLLEALPGVGEAKAQAIVDYRNEHGFFRDINELINVPGFGETIFENIKNLITVND